MNRLAWGFSIFFVVIYGSYNAHGSPLRLSEALEQGLSSSPKTQRAESYLRESEWKKTEAYAGFLPTLTASASYLFDKKYLLVDVALNGLPVSIPQVIPTSNLYITAQWSLFDGFSSTYRLRSGRSLEASAKSDLDWTRFQVEREITLLFYRALAAKEMQAVAEQNLKALDNHLRNVRLFRKVGSSTNIDVLRVEVLLSEAQSEELNAADNVETSKARLSEALGADQDVGEIEGELPRLKKDLISDIKFDVITERSDLKSLMAKVEALNYQERAAEKYWVPKVFLMGQYQYYNNRTDGFDDYDNYREAYYYGVTLTWNIFDGLLSIARSKQSIEQKYQSEKVLRMAQLKAKRDLDFWKRKFVYFCTLVDARLSDIAKAQESTRLSREGLRAGARTNSDVLDAEADLFRAQAGVVNAQLGAIEALINLELSLGQKIADFK
ncbi:TolC family protein [Bdellovibrio reynosensis]|uniref:TolC family protein n=1 Tax=Bdellovibrio reynosensis TaxID=2835041 RepID=A0ABY4CAT8_9BACT|nr:TolC family protein [Bdellovibrio reynosensis]UOF02092.1 TolC family protein [Bdellovibrio reynosensis]